MGAARCCVIIVRTRRRAVPSSEVAINRANSRMPIQNSIVNYSQPISSHTCDEMSNRLSVAILVDLHEVICTTHFAASLVAVQLSNMLIAC